MTWWLTVHTPDRVVCWRVSDDADLREDEVCRARVLTGFPVGDDWIRDPLAQWRLTLTEGPPHPRLGAVMDAADLGDANRAAVAAYRSRRNQAASAARREAARAALLECTSDERAEVMREMPPRSAVSDGEVRGG